MSKVERIEAEIAKLKPAQVRRIAKWLADYEASLWDEEIKRDARPGGALDRLAKKAIEDYRAGRTRPFP